jgi:carbonic anhydrase
MHRLIPGIRKFRKSVFPARRAQFEQLASGQKPSSLFITCSDSRIVPELLTQTEPGDMFVLRNAGNLVPPCSAALSGEAATIEYALHALKVEEIIICGHSHCGAIAGLLRPELVEDLPNVGKWLAHAADVWQAITIQDLASEDSDDLMSTAGKANVFVQLQHLRTYPAIAEAEARGDVRLHGYFYRFETGEVTVLDEARRRFARLSTIKEGQVANANGAAL